MHWSCVLINYSDQKVITCLNMVLQDVPVIRPRLRMLEVTEVDHDAMPHGDTGEAFIESIPFQVI